MVSPPLLDKTNDPVSNIWGGLRECLLILYAEVKFMEVTSFDFLYNILYFVWAWIDR